MNTAVVQIRFTTAAEAQRAGQSLAPDHGQYVKWRLEGTTLILETSAENTLSLVRTLDDVLGCIRALGVA